MQCTVGDELEAYFNGPPGECGPVFKVTVHEHTDEAGDRIKTEYRGAWITRYRNNILHCEDAPAEECFDGNVMNYWYFNGKPHRDGGPAVEVGKLNKEWYFHGVLHRVDGPAVVSARGACEYWIHGNQLSELEWRREWQPDDTHSYSPEFRQAVRSALLIKQRQQAALLIEQRQRAVVLPQLLTFVGRGWL